MTEKKRRVIVPNKKQEIDANNMMVVPPVEALMADALSIIGNELARFRAKSNRGVSLEYKECRAVQMYMDALVKLSREERERARSEDLSNLSDDELRQLAESVLGRNLGVKTVKTEEE